MVALGVLAALFAGVFRYVDQHFHTPETFIENTATLGDNADIRERLFEGFRTEIIAIADGEDLTAVAADDEDAADGGGDDAEEAEPEPDVPITDERIERDQAIEAILLDTFDSDLYTEVFAEQMTSVQTQLIRSAELQDNELLRDSGQISFDARRLYQPIYVALGADERTAEITQNELPDTYGIYSIADRETTVNGAWWFIENGPNWRGLSTAIAVLSLIGALVIAERRPSRAIQFGAGIVGLALVVIVIVYIVRAVVPVLTSGSAGPVVATYVANTAPLVSVMFRLLIMGVILAVVGGIARLIWPDDWVYGHIADDRGVRSIQRRRGTPEPQAAPQPQVQQPAAAAPVGYAPYGQQPYPGYPPQPGWGYPGQPYAPVPYQYPVGPYAQPAPQQGLPQAAPQSTGRPTVPVMPISAEASIITGENPAVDGQAFTQGVADRPPADAAQAVPRVVASTNIQRDAATESADAADQVDDAKADSKDDDWSSDGDW